MYRSAFLVPLALLVSCAASDRARYTNTYQIAGSQSTFDEFSAERAHIATSNSKQLLEAQQSLEEPIRLLQAPQPVMSAADIEDGVVGEVVVDIRFGKDGLVEKTTIIRSTKDTLSDAVLDAVSHWVVAPPTLRGKPTTLVARQSFKFRSALAP